MPNPAVENAAPFNTLMARQDCRSHAPAMLILQACSFADVSDAKDHGSYVEDKGKSVIDELPACLVSLSQQTQMLALFAATHFTHKNVSSYCKACIAKVCEPDVHADLMHAI